MQKASSLIINDGLSSKSSNLMSVIRSHEGKSLTAKKFVFSKAMSAKLVPKRENVVFKNVRLVEAKQGAYIEYYYLIPEDLLQHVPSHYLQREWFRADGTLKKWARFRWKEELNKIGTREYKESKVSDLRHELEKGLDPFEFMKDQYSRQQATEAAIVAPVTSLSNSEKAFLGQYKNEGSKEQYKAVMLILKEYFTSRPETMADMWHQDVRHFTKDMLTGFLETMQERRDWSANTYNGNVDKVKTVFQYFVKKEHLVTSPAKLLERLPGSDIKRNKYYSDEFLPIVKKAILAVPYWGQYLLQFSETIYWTFTRPDVETRRLKAGDINWHLKTITIRKEIAKGGYGGTIHMPAEAATLFMGMGIKDCPPDWYIFGKDGPPGPELTPEDFYADRFLKDVKRPNGFDMDYTLYGFKHRRCVQLFLGGATVAYIMQLCRHKSPTTTEKYLRSLGCDIGVLRHEGGGKF